MRRVFQIFLTLVITMFLSCEDKLEINLEDVSEKTKNCGSTIEVEILDCGMYEITSTKDLSNIVYRIDGVDTKIEPLSGYNYLLEIEGVTDIWVKSGCNKSGDGPGYGEHFTIDDTEFCNPDPRCLDSNDCPNTLSCGEGGICTTIIGGRVFLDVDGNGVFSPGDTPIPSVLVRLQVLVGSTWFNNTADLSDDSGYYSFTGKNSTFTYRITVDSPNPANGDVYTFTTKDIGLDDTIDSDVDASGVSEVVITGYDIINTTVWVGITDIN